MITAKEAKRKTLLKTKLKQYMELIWKEINQAIDTGDMSVSVSLVTRNDDIIQTIITEMESLGYKVKYIPEKPAPTGCPSDQWFSKTYLKISWED